MMSIYDDIYSDFDEDDDFLSPSEEEKMIRRSAKDRRGKFVYSDDDFDDDFDNG